jgi:hypothetical protein
MSSKLLQKNAAISIQDRTLYHGTNSSEEFTNLKPDDHGIIWLAERNAAGAYATTHYKDGESRVLQVHLTPSAQIVDLRDATDPVTQQVKAALESAQVGWYGIGHKLTDQQYVSYVDFGLLEGYPWMRKMLRKLGVDAVIVNDTHDGGMKHDSLAVLNAKVISGVTPEPVVKMAADDALVLDEGKSLQNTADEYSSGMEPKKRYGCALIDIPNDSLAGEALHQAAAVIDPDDLAGDGMEEDYHVTVRYGIEAEDDLFGMIHYLSQQAPFDITFGPVEMFPPSPGSDNAEFVILPVVSDTLKSLNTEIEKHGIFKPADFDYKPHAILAYDAEGKAQKYVGTTPAEGITYTVRSIVLSDANKKRIVVPLMGGTTSNF